MADNDRGIVPGRASISRIDDDEAVLGAVAGVVEQPPKMPDCNCSC